MRFVEDSIVQHSSLTKGDIVQTPAVERLEARNGARLENCAASALLLLHGWHDNGFKLESWLVTIYWSQGLASLVKCPVRTSGDGLILGFMISDFLSSHMILLALQSDPRYETGW